MGFRREAGCKQWISKILLQHVSRSSAVFMLFQVYIVDLTDKIIKFREDCDHWNLTMTCLCEQKKYETGNEKGEPFPGRFSSKNLFSSSNSGLDESVTRQNLHQHMSK
jgi:hypothetical protein